MNPISSDIFGRLDWLTKRIKNIYGRLTALETATPTPGPDCYLEIVSDNFPYTDLAGYNSNTDWATPFTALVTVGTNIQRLYGGSDVYIGSMFASNATLKSINDQCGAITGMDDYAFVDCSTLTFVNLTGVTNLPNNLFRHCHELSALLLPKLETIGNDAFHDGKVTDLSLPMLTSMGSNGFTNNAFIKTVYAPKLTFVPASTFNSCSALISVDISSATFIDDVAFQNCTNLTSVIATSAQGVGSDTFRDCTSLPTISLPKATVLFERAFQQCQNLASIIAPKVTEITNEVFVNCFSLTTMNFPIVAVMGTYAFLNCENLTNISFPAVKGIGHNAFDGCFRLTSISLPVVTDLGGSPSDDSVFRAVGESVTLLTVPVAMATIDGGKPDGDILMLAGNNNLTINYV